ncbi:MAG: PAS domain-containing sensor histidine kinase [Actinobacteria bacterium]|nr:PAS domain-containing sensor histidine kinase [Actinomycetota bacterium]
MLQQLPAGVIVVDAAGRLLFGNDFMDEMLGPPTKSEAGEPTLEQYAVYHADGKPYEPDERPLFRAIKTKRPVPPVELDVRRPNGELSVLMVSANPVCDADGNVILGIAVYVDITERKALEAERAALYERERRFTADVTHDLRNPLAALVSSASLLEDHLHELPDPARRPAELMVDSVGRLRRLVDDLMELARIDARREVVFAEEVDLRRAVQGVIRSCGWEKRVGIEDDAGACLDGDAALMVDRRRLDRILANLIGNATAHGKRDVCVRLGRDGDDALVEVTDRGEGIAREHLPHLFERFYKADATRSSGGSGLGLAIALENARLMGGTIDAGNRPGGGARFTLRLPLTREPAEGPP